MKLKKGVFLVNISFEFSIKGRKIEVFRLKFFFENAVKTPDIRRFYYMTNLSFVESQSHVFEGRLDPFLRRVSSMEVHGGNSRGLDDFCLTVNLHIESVKLNNRLVLTRWVIIGLATDLSVPNPVFTSRAVGMSYIGMVSGVDGVDLVDVDGNTFVVFW